MTVDGRKCPECQSSDTGRSPTGIWCNACGWNEPGLVCGVCGRHDVGEEHKTPGGKPCAASPDELRKPGMRPRSFILLLQATDDPRSPQAIFAPDGAIEYRNFDPSPETRGLMEALAGVIIGRPLELAQVLIDFEQSRVEVLRGIDRRHAEKDVSDV